MILTKYATEKVFGRLQQLTVNLKLKLNQKKTRIVDAEKESFDFLGYSFRKTLNPKKTKVAAYFWPSQKAERSIREKIKKDYQPSPTDKGRRGYRTTQSSTQGLGKLL